MKTKASFNQSGMILLLTLLLLGVITALILTQLEMLLVYQKSTNHWILWQKMHHNLEQFAVKIMAQTGNLRRSQCVIPMHLNPNESIAELSTNRGCLGVMDKINYYYSLEDLGIQPCLQALVDDKHYSTHHWRLTLVSEAAPQDILQIRFAKLAEYQLCLDNPIRQITPGLVSWRES